MVHSIDQSNSQRKFGDMLKAVRLRVGLSQEELAHRAELDRTYVSSCERGKRNVSLETIVRLAIALDVPPSLLLSGLDRPQEDQ